MQKRFLILLFFSLLTFGNILAQAPKSFNSDAAVFIKELRAYMELTNKKETEKLLDKFEIIWISEPRFTAEQQGIVIRTANNMLKKRLKPYPDFSNYVQALIAFSASGKGDELFQDWHSSMQEVLNLSSKRYSDYIEDMAGLFNANILHATASSQWVAGTSEYKFEFDSVPKVIFPAMDLKCFARGDSSVIEGISGAYFPLTQTFSGKSGKLTWTRAGLPANEVYAELSNTEINTGTAEWSSDDVLFYHRKFFKNPLSGSVRDKILADVSGENVTYPRFQSKDLQLSIPEIIKDADYLGGFAQHGSKMIGSGTREQKATVTFKPKGKVSAVIASKNFVIRPDRIASESASFTCYFENDSIYHPALQVRYNSDDRTLNLFRATQAGVSMPFFDTWHQMDIFVDAISWKIDDPLMEFKMTSGQGESKMILESTSLYTDERFESIQGMADVSPLFTIKQYVEKNSRYIYPADFAKYLRVSDQQARSLLIFLANKGFVSYDAEEDVAGVNDKLYYYLSARSNKTDFDKIEIASVISAQSNAKLNLLNFDLDINGAGRILLSDSQQVWIAPANQEIRLQKNRDMEFSGRVHAGRSDFFGKKFKFNYEQFKIGLPTIDSIRLKVLSETELDENGNPKLITIKNTLQNVSGTLHIDSLYNKSGRKNFAGYPLFLSDKEAYLYYDHPSVYNGVYSRDRFYFKVDPFAIDSLDNFAAGGLRFNGLFESGGIFPPIRETAHLRPDYSFGFEQDAPSSGYPMYAGRGTFRQHIDLSFQGLIGSGEVDYLSSTSKSDDIVFFPDSTNLSNAQWDLRRSTIAGIGYPDAKGRDNFINWRPNTDQMYVYKTSGELSAYNGTVSLDGNLLLSNKGLGGNGTAFFQESELAAANFRFQQDGYGADTSDFKLRSDDETALAIQTKNVLSKIDLVKRVGSFSSNGKGSYVSFPLNQYICFIAQFKWFIDNKEVEFGEDDMKNTKLNIEGSDFVSTNPFQDSLRWNAGLARYSLLDYLIKAKNLKPILVADAAIQPNDTATIIVERNAYMRPLINASITANTVSRYHSMIEARVEIQGRKKYEASGRYAYTDHAGVQHLLLLDRIAVDTSLQTYATGNLPDTANFQISKNIQYKGRVNLTASNPLLNFDGFAKLSHRCEEKLSSSWFSFRGDIDPNGVNIPVMSPKNEISEKLNVGLSLSSDSSGFYPSFLSPKKRSADADVITAGGFLTWDDKQKVYKITDSVKLKSPDMPGNMIMLNDENCLVYGEGLLNLRVNLGQVELSTKGNFTFNTNNDSIRFDLLAGLEFMFSQDAMRAMADVIREQSALKATNDNRSTWVRGMKEYVGVERTDKMISEFSLYGAPRKVPDEIQKTIFFTELNIIWDPAAQAYRSQGPIGIGFIGKETIGRQLTGHLEIQRRRGVDVLNLYLEADKNTWWYFNYSRGIMQSISSDMKFNDAISNLKPEKRVAKEKGDAEPYEYMLSTDRKKAEFLRRMQPE